MSTAENVADCLKRLHALPSALAVCAAEGVRHEDVFVPHGRRCRAPRVVRARHRIWTLLRHTLGLSYPEIAEVFQVDHSSVMHGVRKYEAELAQAYAEAAP